jgi:ABC-type Mn2+/Zn2+ transport system ATPase subunit
MVATHDLDQARRYFDRVMLLNHKVIAFGVAKEVLKSDNLIVAYGGKIQVNLEGQMLVDDCCHEE